MNKVHIKNKDCLTFIFLNDSELHGITNATITFGLGGTMPTLNLTILLQEVEITVNDVEISKTVICPDCRKIMEES